VRALNCDLESRTFVSLSLGASNFSSSLDISTEIFVLNCGLFEITIE
jgi:hypothetical protein